MSDINKIIGTNIKNLRLKYELTLDQASELTGVSKSMIGQIERGESTPTVTTLWKICNGLKTSFSTLMKENDPGAVVVSKTDLQSLSSMDNYNLFTYIPFDTKRKFEAFNMEFLGKTEHSSEAHVGAVEEFVFVIEGAVDVQVNDTCHQLEQNDMLRFNANSPHRYCNPHGTKAGLFIIIVYQ